MKSRLWSAGLAMFLLLLGCLGKARPCTWRIMPSPPVQGDPLQNLLAFSDTDVWAVESFRDQYQARLHHWDGTRWRGITSPRLAAAANWLYGMAGTAPDDVWISGVSYPTGKDSRSRPLMLHWDGRALSVVPTPDLNSPRGGLTAMTAVARDDVWAVGWFGALGDLALAEHWDGKAWEVSPLPLPRTGGHIYDRLVAVAARSASDVWAVGREQETSEYALVLHWDGHSWRRLHVPSDLFMARQSPHIIVDDLRAVVPLGLKDVWFVGSGSRAQIVDGQARALEPWADALVPLLLHWDGRSWVVSKASSSALPGNGYELIGGGSSPNGRAWAVGSIRQRGGANTQPLAYELRGSDWERVQTPFISPAPLHMDDFRANKFLAVDSTVDGHPWAVGHFFTAEYEGFLPLVERCA